MRLLVALLAFPSTAAAHHVVSDWEIDPGVPRTSVDATVEAAAIHRRERSASWQLVDLGVELAPVDWGSLAMRIPIARVAIDGEPAVIGISDLELSLKVRIVATEGNRFVFAGGTGLELPTGDPERGLGSGHVEIAPFVAASFVPARRTTFVFVLADRAALGGDGAHEHVHADEEQHVHGSVLAPHAENELAARIVAAQVFEPFYGSVGVDASWILSGEEGIAPYVARAEAGWYPTKDVRLAIGADVPFAGDARFDWRARLGFLLRL